jgi:PKD repeat protein
MKRELLMTMLALGLAALSTPVFADATVTNGILSVSPSCAPQGTVGLLVTFNLSSSSTPPLPPANVVPTGARIGTNIGSSLARPSQYITTARFTISASESTNDLKDVAVSIPYPGGTLTYDRLQGFQVVAGSGIPVAGYTATPNYGTSPLTVSFADASSGTVTNRLWDFGDKTTGTNVNPTHTYSNVTTYTVSLTVFGGCGTPKSPKV